MTEQFDRSAIHESAHSVAFLAGGVAVELLTIDGTGGGKCTPATDSISPDVRLLASLAGREGENLWFGGDGQMSGEDCSHAKTGAEWLGLCMRKERERAESQAYSFCYHHRAEITFLARHLLNSRVLRTNDISRLCHSPSSPLACYSKLYTKPKPSQRGQLANLNRPKPRRVTAAELEEYLDTVEENGTQTMRELCS